MASNHVRECGLIFRMSSSCLPAASAWNRHTLTRFDIALAVALAVLSLLARWPFIERGQTIVHHDEATVGLMAQDIARGEHFPIYFYGQRYMGALEAYVVAALLPWCSNQAVALRLGPALFLAALVAVQFLMCARWFGRWGGCVAAGSLICLAPMGMHWTISARGGYIEIMLWGALTWWLFAEWFVCRNDAGRWKKAAFGVLLGSGLWLNATIVAFIAPVIVSQLLSVRPRWLQQSTMGTAITAHWKRWTFDLPLALPLLGLLFIVALSAIYCVEVSKHGVEFYLFMGLVSIPVGVAMLGVLVVIAALALRRQAQVQNWLRQQTNAAAPLILGMFVGYLPAIGYVVVRTFAGEGLEDSIPLGVRPLWTMHETVSFLISGVPVLFGADPRPFLDLLLIDPYNYPLRSLPAGRHELLGWFNLGILAAAVVLIVLLLIDHGRKFLPPLRLQFGQIPPAVFLSFAVLAFGALFLFSGCSFNFFSIRYLIPVWVAIAGLLGAVAASARWKTVRFACLAILFAGWTAGQGTLWQQIGAPHPLTDVAQSLVDQDISLAVAEPQDAKLLSYLTSQATRVAEYKPTWPRLTHVARLVRPHERIAYITRTDEKVPHKEQEWPGRKLSSIHRLRPDLEAWVRRHPHTLISKSSLPQGFELWLLTEPIHEESRPAITARPSES